MDEISSFDRKSKSFIFSIIGGAVSIFGGITLATLKAQGDASLLEALANGIGFYCIGKGIYMIAMVFQLREAEKSLLSKK